MTTYVNHEVFKRIENIMSGANMAFKAGKIWDSIDEQVVCEMYDRGLELLELCKQLGRSPLGILERLKKYGRVRHDNTTGDWVRCATTTIGWNADPYPTGAVSSAVVDAAVIKAIQELKKEIDSMKIDQTQNVGTIPSGAYFVSNTATNPTWKESNTMTKPLEHKAFLFGIEITKLTEEDLVRHIKRANDEINSYASIPENNYTKLRIANLKDAIEAAVKELNKRGE